MSAEFRTSLNEPDEDFDDLPMLLHEKTGGVLRYVARLRRVTLALGLRTNACRVTRELILMAANSPEMIGVMGQIAMLSERNLEGLARWRDLPSDLVRPAWTPIDPKSAEGEGVTPAPQPKAPKAPKSSARRQAPTQTGVPPIRGNSPSVSHVAASSYRTADFRARLVTELEQSALDGTTK